jgi:O-antigen/teichoic acid export membrane protein
MMRLMSASVTPDTPPAPVAPPPDRRPFAGIAGRITVINLLVNALTLVSGPLQARALGPGGRGELAAIVVPLAFTPILADLGLSTYVLNEVAKGSSPRRIVGAIAPITVSLGVLLALVGPLLAMLIGGGRQTVELFLVIGFAAMPLTLFMNLLNAINWARERWGVWIAVRLTPSVGGLLVTLVLYMLGDLTVEAAAAATIALGLLSSVPLLGNLREIGALPWSRDRQTSRQGLRFGLQAWLGGLAQQTNARVDQLLMTRLVTSRELGLYAVAVNAGAVQQSISSAVISVLLPRASGGDVRVVPRALRMTLFITSVLSAAGILLVGIVLPLLFGHGFHDGVNMARILLVAAVPYAGAAVSSAALTARGAPGIAARGEIISLLVTVPGLILFLPSHGGEGAACVSLVAYSVSFAYQMVHLRRRLGGSVRSFFIVSRSDWPPLVEGIRDRGRRRTG